MFSRECPSFCRVCVIKCLHHACFISPSSFKVGVSLYSIWPPCGLVLSDLCFGASSKLLESPVSVAKDLWNFWLHQNHRQTMDVPWMFMVHHQPCRASSALKRPRRSYSGLMPDPAASSPGWPCGRLLCRFVWTWRHTIQR